MDLYATGFNAWSQLRFPSPSLSPKEEEPDDLFSFTCVSRDVRAASVRPFLSYTVGKILPRSQRPIPDYQWLRVEHEVTASSGLQFAGSVPKEHEILHRSNEDTHVNFVEASNGVVVGSDASLRLSSPFFWAYTHQSMTTPETSSSIPR